MEIIYDLNFLNHRWFKIFLKINKSEIIECFQYSLSFLFVSLMAENAKENKS